MSVDPVSGTSPNTYESPLAGRRQKLDALENALQSGDLESAQTAFAALQPQSAQSASIGAVGANARNQFASDLQAVGQALKAGDLTGAPQAFALMRQHRLHGRHHDAGASVTPREPHLPASSAASTPMVVDTSLWEHGLSDYSAGQRWQHRLNGFQMRPLLSLSSTLGSAVKR